MVNFLILSLDEHMCQKKRMIWKVSFFLIISFVIKYVWSFSGEQQPPETTEELSPGKNAGEHTVIDIVNTLLLENSLLLLIIFFFFSLFFFV